MRSFGHLVLATLPLLLAAACGDGPASPSPSSPALASQSQQALVEEFVAAQGTYCTADGGTSGSCFNLFGPDGPPDVVLFCDLTTPTPCPYFDTGVEQRWIIEQGGSDVGTTWSGTAREQRLPDGRRHVWVSVHYRDAIVQLADLEVLSAYFDNQEALEPELALGHLAHAVLGGATPVLGDHAMTWEFILPADYAGMPDIVELVFAPAEGMELIAFRQNGSARGPMRRDYLGLEAGDDARLSLHFNWDATKEGELPGQARAVGIRATAGSPGMHLTVR